MIRAFLSGFIIGISIGSFVPLNIWILIAIALLGAIVFIYKYFVEEDIRMVLVVISIFIFSLFVGMSRMWLSDLNRSSELDRFANKRIEAVGVIVSEPDVRDENTRLTVKLENVTLGKETFKVNEKILTTVPVYPEYQYGDRVELSTFIVSPKNIISEDGRVFDYEGYLRVRGIWYLGQKSNLKLLSQGNGNAMKSALFKTKKYFTNSIGRVLPEPESSLMAGLLLGAKQSLGKNLLAEFQKTGVSHLVVLSGYNIAIVAESIMNTLSFLPKKIAFGSGLTSIILFTIFSGGGASAWRAAIMVLVALFAKHFNRDYKASRALGFAVVVMLAPNPLLLAFDPSFQLSILATIGLVFVSPIVSNYLTKVPEKVVRFIPLREILSTTVATQITVLPFLIYNTGLVSLVSLPVNILVLGTIPITMFFGFLTGIFGFFSTYLSYIPAVFSYILLKYQLAIIHIGASLPFGHTKLPAFSLGVLLLIYIIIFILYFRMNKNITLHS